ncbi:TolC family protein [Legionella tunisiensis]|uniref:TolC family protein n=1 Tax=Legionella tunisiensis TaxID=1034944 RepID=UPI00047524EC
MKISAYRRIVFFICLIFIVRIPLTFASGLTLAQLSNLAIQNNNDLKAAQYNISLARARLVQAGLWPNPSLALGNTDDRFFTNEGEYTTSIGFNQAFPVSGRIGKKKNLARVDVALAITEIKNAKRLLKAKVADNYYAILITDRRLEQLNNLLAINQQLMRVTQNRFQAAEVSELDTNIANLEYQRILQEKQILDSLRISQIAQLNQLLGQAATTPLYLNKTVPPTIQLPRLPDLQATAIQQRPEIRMAWLNLHRAQADQQLARAERWADWTIGLGVQQNKIAVEGAPIQTPDRALSINLSIPFPLFNANQGRILETSTAGTQTLMQLKALKLTIQTEIASSYAQVQALQTALQQSQQGPLKLTVRNVELARNAYRNGQISLLEVLQVQRQHNDLQVAYLNMLEKYTQALVKLCTALGTDQNSKLCPYLSTPRNLHGSSKTC